MRGILETLHSRVFLFFFLVISTPILTAPTKDYNGNPLGSAGVTITPKSLSSALASSFESVNFAGLVDKTFGSAGAIITPLTTPTGFENCAAGLLQSDGKIIAVGTVNINPAGGGGGNCALIRYNTDGTIDTSFGSNGSSITSITGSDRISAGILQSDGKIVIAGMANVGIGVSDVLVSRYTSSGQLDPSFNGTGSVITHISGFDFVSDVTLQPDNKIVVVGQLNPAGAQDFLTIRYNSDGSPDQTFNGTGIVTTSLSINSDFASSVLIQPDKKIVVLGTANDTGATNYCALVRYTSTGSLDPSFGNEGIVTTQITAGGVNGFSTGLLLMDGTILAGGNSGTRRNITDFALACYTSTGLPNHFFGTDGIVITSLSVNRDGISSILQQPDGFFVVAGTSNETAGTSNIALARYTITGQLDPTFGTAGTVTTAISSYCGANTVLLEQNGNLIITGTNGNPTVPFDEFLLVRYSNPLTLSTFTTSYGGVGFL